MIYSIIKCPSCHEGNGLHHSAVEVFQRPEDADEPSVIVHGDGSTSEGDGHRNPSGRRNGIRITLICEHCGPCGFLCIAQDKGEEHIWVERIETVQQHIELEPS